MSATSEIREFVRCLPPMDDKSEKAFYIKALSKAVGCDASIVRNAIRDLNEDADSITPFETYKQDSNALINAYDEGDILIAFEQIGMYLVNVERYGKRACDNYDITNKSLLAIVTDFMKYMARFKKMSYVDTLIYYLNEYGDFSREVNCILDGEAYDSDYFPLEVNDTYIDSFAARNGVIREAVTRARYLMYNDPALLQGLITVPTVADIEAAVPF